LRDCLADDDDLFGDWTGKPAPATDLFGAYTTAEGLLDEGELCQLTFPDYGASPNELDFSSALPALPPLPSFDEKDKAKFPLHGSFGFNLEDFSTVPLSEVGFPSPASPASPSSPPTALIPIEPVSCHNEPIVFPATIDTVAGEPSNSVCERVDTDTASSAPVFAAASSQHDYGLTKKGVPRRKPGRKSRAEKAALPARMPPRGSVYPEDYRRAFLRRFVEKRKLARMAPAVTMFKYEVRREFAAKRQRIGGRFVPKEVGLHANAAADLDGDSVMKA